MEAKELMIGDWCAYGVNCKGRVTALTEHLITLSVDGNEVNGLYMLMPDMIRPIPLTEEILVKNGFKRHLLWHETDDGSKIYIPLACGGGIEYVSIYKHFEDLTVRDIDIEIPIHYVHQLQHLLRLCGIEKEIEL